MNLENLGSNQAGRGASEGRSRGAVSWSVLLQQALERHEDRAAARWVQLATIRDEHRPANRTVAFRGFYGTTEVLQFTTDLRSAKVGQIARNPGAEACWYLPETREQFRISGTLSLIGPEDPKSWRLRARREAWEALSLSSRRTFAGPEPGARRADPETLKIRTPTEAEPLASFGLLLLVPDEVDYLDLRPDPHFRRLYRRGGDSWSAEDVNA